MGVYQTIHTLELQRKIPLGEVSRWRGRLYNCLRDMGQEFIRNQKTNRNFICMRRRA